MRKLFSTVLISACLSTPVLAEGFDAIQPANPFTPQQIPLNTIQIQLKKATLTHNSIHNQYVIAFDRFMQSNVKSAYMDFKVLIETMDESDFAYMKMAENLSLIHI